MRAVFRAVFRAPFFAGRPVRFALVLEVDPEAAWAYGGRGSIYAERGQWKEAAADFAKAVELDPSFSSAYALAAVVYSARRQNGWMVNIAEESAEAIKLARLAIETGQTDGRVLCRGGFILALFDGELDFGAECTRRGLTMNPNFAYGWSYSAYVQLYLGEYDIALEHFRKNERLDPCDSARMYRQSGTALSHFFLGNYKEAMRVLEKTVSEFPTFASGW